MLDYNSQRVLHRRRFSGIYITVGNNRKLLFFVDVFRAGDGIIADSLWIFAQDNSEKIKESLQENYFERLGLYHNGDQHGFCA